MRTYDLDEFLVWATERGLKPDPRYPGSTFPTFDPNPELYRFWELPRDAATRPKFLSRVLSLAGPWRSCQVRRLGGWPAAGEASGVGERVAHRVLGALGIPLGTNAVVEFDVSEIDSLLALLLVSTIFGWSAVDDLFLVLDPPRYLLKTEHHGLVQVCFRTRDDLDEFVRSMERARISLPTSGPDQVMRQDAWADWRNA